MREFEAVEAGFVQRPGGQGGEGTRGETDAARRWQDPERTLGKAVEKVRPAQDYPSEHLTTVGAGEGPLSGPLPPPRPTRGPDPLLGFLPRSDLVCVPVLDGRVLEGALQYGSVVNFPGPQQHITSW
ncbi:hypothetical protein GZL_07650 [Streptomyces sp. 769]|nr:hypothetical protein GZL_07650 [Streptomyces sp. 769]